MADGMPRDDRGLRPCAWCGGPIQQPATGRRRDYCSRTHRELAYRARKAEGTVTDALQWDEDAAKAWLVAHGVPTRPDTSVDETRPAPPDTSVDETWGVRPPARGNRGQGMTAWPLFRAAE